MVKRMNLRPEQFFAMHPLPMNAGRVFILSGRGRELAALYRQAAARPRRRPTASQNANGTPESSTFTYRLS